MNMDDAAKLVEKLSPRKRALFEMLLEEKRKGKSVAQGPAIRPRTSAAPPPVSFSQHRLWFIDRMMPASSVYNVPGAIRLCGPLNVAALEQSINEVIRRHEALRTTFQTADGEPVQVIASNLLLPLSQVDLSIMAESVKEEQAIHLAKQEARNPFDISLGPLLRAVLIRLDMNDHILVITMHHIVSDGWSISILIREVAALYEAFCSGSVSPLPELPIQYADFAIWQRQYLQGELFQKQLAYWKEQFIGTPPALDLPTDRLRPAIQTHRRAEDAVILSKSTGESLKALCRREGVTLFMALLATFKVLLHRYTNKGDIVVGTPISNRSRIETSGLIGFFVNTLALRTDFSGDPGFLTALARLRETALAAYAHQDLPFEKLVEELKLQRDLSRPALFQVMFLLRTDQMPEVKVAGLTLTPVAINNDALNFDLIMDIEETERGSKVLVEYNPDLFEPATISRMLGHFQTLLDGILENPERRLSELPLLRPAEKHEILIEWNATRTDYGDKHILHHLIEAQAERTPSAIALRFEDRHLSYDELNRRANQLAHHLLNLGVRVETLVGLFAERSIEMVIALLAILKCGAAYVPFDTEYPKDRLAFMLEDACPPVLLTQQHLIARLPDYGGHVVTLDSDWQTHAPDCYSNPATGINDQNLAYVIYTSGSTGQPKGAMNTHRAICNRLLWMQEAYRLNATDRVLQKTPCSFDVSVWEFFWPLMTGACLVIAKPGGHRDNAYLARLIAEHGITTLHFVPSMLELFLEAGELDGCKELRRVICSGEALSLDLQERFFKRIDAQLHNLYGPTEAAVDVTSWACRSQADLRAVPIGHPIANTRIYLLDSHLQPVPVNVGGELHIGGTGLARGYINRAALTAERFIPDPFSDEPGARLYQTGDLARFRPDGSIEYLGRLDHQVKIRGFRIELGEIEAVLAQQAEVREAVVVAFETQANDKRLVAYIVPASEPAPTPGQLRSSLAEKLPEYMLPSAFVMMSALPLSANGKIDRKALPAPDASRPELESIYAPPRTEVEKQIAAIWQDVLKVEQVGRHDHFFDLGGHSLLLARVQARLLNQLGADLSIVDLFKYTTISSLAGAIAVDSPAPVEAVKTGDRRNSQPRAGRTDEIAIIGMTGRFPGAGSVGEFWRNLRQGVESVTFFTDAELEHSGVDAAIRNRPDYVKAGAILEDIEQFDAAFFGFNPREAEITDPQHRLFLECAYEALESCGYGAHQRSTPVGVFAGVTMGTYWMNFYPALLTTDTLDPFLAKIGNDKDHLTTLVSYKLDLSGPSVVVQTTCSTSLVATHLACQSLLNGECDMALAGGISISVPQNAGYIHKSGGITSPDGHCRAFDAKAQGTIFGSGVGIVVLKRLADAIADKDNIHAIIKGTAINNDGALKVGYTAPSISGQTDVILQAQAQAGIHPEMVSYIETHGTGTSLGDPIEIAALTEAFRAKTGKKNFCAIGSVKTNIGHLDAAAGIAGLIKTACALKHKMLPPSLNFEEPNPNIDFASSPFYVNAHLRDWDSAGKPRIAGVSSFGIGGTNAHVIMGEAPPLEDDTETRPFKLLPLSAKTNSALEQATENLADYLSQHPQVNLDDVAYTLQVGRRAYEYRRAFVCGPVDDAVAVLRERRPISAGTSPLAQDEPQIVFMFPGQGSQYVRMGAELYESEESFRENVDRSCELLEPHLHCDLRKLIYPQEAELESSKHRIKQADLAQCAIFVIEYALARMWMKWGVQPCALIGHSLGEYVAACIAGVFTLEEALALVAARGRLMQSLPEGRMISLPLAESDVIPLLSDGLSIAAVNSQSNCVVSGPTATIDALIRRLDEQGIVCRALETSHAFHSAMMEPILEPFREKLKAISCRPPIFPYVSNLTGSWIEREQAVGHTYWADHLRHTVRFSEGIAELLRGPYTTFLEIGPGQTLSSLVKQTLGKGANKVVLASMPHREAKTSEAEFLHRTLARLWLEGTQVNWSAYHAKKRRRVTLPTYPFERKRYWIDPQKSEPGVKALASSNGRADMADWFYVPSWRQSSLPARAKAIDEQRIKSPWLILMDSCGLGAEIADHLRREGEYVITITDGKRFVRTADDQFIINPRERDDYVEVFKELRSSNLIPQTILHLWSVTPERNHEINTGTFEELQWRGFHSLIYLAQALGEQHMTAVFGGPESAPQIQLVVISNEVCAITPAENLCPDKATLLGPCKVIAQEYANITSRAIDINLPEPGTRHSHRLIKQLLREMKEDAHERIVAYRSTQRWVQGFQPVRLDDAGHPALLRQGGTYLLTGGTGAVGLKIAEYLARSVKANLILLGQSNDLQKIEGRWKTTGDKENGARRVEMLESLEALGVEVLVLSADVANAEQMRDAIARAYERFGAINGVIHAAGIAGGGLIQLQTSEAAEQMFRAKVYGSRIVASLFSHCELDFLIFFSSRRSILGGIGQVDFCAASAFVDAFAQRYAVEHETPSIVINWDTFNDAGMVVDAASRLNFEVAGEGISTAEGVAAFNRIISSQLPQVIVSVENFNALVESYETGPSLDALETRRKPSTSHARPQLAASYVAPGNETEKTIATVWQDALGIETVGVNDDFFELGGHSLIAIQLVAQLSSLLSTQLRMQDLFVNPTVAGLAATVEAMKASLAAPAMVPVSREAYRIKLPAKKSSSKRT
jgi:amino acid adenylation domain-containing protein